MIKEIQSLLSAYKTVAVVGISPNPDRPSHVVASYLQSKDTGSYRSAPMVESFWGKRSIKASGTSQRNCVDIVDVFRKSTEVLPIVEKQSNAEQMVWMQEGLSIQDAAAKAEKAGLKVVMDRCIKKEHQSCCN